MTKRKEFEKRLHSLEHGVAILENMIANLRDDGEVDLLRNRVDVMRRKVMEIEMWQKVHEGTHDFVLTRGVQGKADLELLCDFLGVGFVDTAAKRAVVKKTDGGFTTEGKIAHPFNPSPVGGSVTSTNGIDWAFSGDQYKEKT